jgi:flagellar motor switch protein FliN/FliY
MLSLWAGAFRRMGIESSLSMNTLDKIEVEISVELGAATLPIHHLLRMGRGAVIELDSMHDDPLKIYANNTLIARGEVRIEDGRLSIEVTEKMFKRA